MFMNRLPHLFCEFGTTDGPQGLVPRHQLNRTLTMPDGRPMVLSDRAVDDATFWANYGGDSRGLRSLEEFRRLRAQLIESYFKQCARHVIDKLEEREEWGRFGEGGE